VNLNVTTRYKELAPVVAAKLAEEFRDQDREREMQGARLAAENLAASIDQLQQTIVEQEAELIAKMRDSNLPLQEKGQDLAAARLGSLSDTWLRAMEARRQLEGRYTAAMAASARGEGMNIPDLYENKIFQDTMRLNTERKAKLQDDIRTIDKQIQAAETEKAELLVRYTPEYPEVQKVEERIATLREQRANTETEVSTIIEWATTKNEK